MSEPYEPGETIATVEWLRGKRLISTFMRKAGLGIEHVGIQETVNIRWKPGEVVDEERVMKAVQAMMAGLDAEENEWQITNPKVVSIRTTPV